MSKNVSRVGLTLEPGVRPIVKRKTVVCWPLSICPRGPSIGSLATGGFTEGVPRVVGVRVGQREMLVAYHLPGSLTVRWGSQPGIRAEMVLFGRPSARPFFAFLKAFHRARTARVNG